MSERTERLARNETLFRAVNERVEEVVQAGADEQIDFFCECGRSDCDLKITLTRGEYEDVRAEASQFAVTPGHEIPEVESVVRSTDRFFVVRKHPGEAAIAQAADPRS